MREEMSELFVLLEARSVELVAPVVLVDALVAPMVLVLLEGVGVVLRSDELVLG